MLQKLIDLLPGLAALAFERLVVCGNYFSLNGEYFEMEEVTGSQKNSSDITALHCMESRKPENTTYLADTRARVCV